jgi:hypothetical protein
MLGWASQGYNYSQQIAALKAERAQFETGRNEHQALIDRYKEFDDFVQKDPNWWNEFNRAYQEKTGNVQAALDPASPLTAEVNSLKQELNDLKSFREDMKKQAEEKDNADADAALAQELKSIREQYADLDWVTADANGLTLEKAILKHAHDNSIPNIRAAFRDFTFDQHISRAGDKGKEAVQADIKKRTKLGLLGEARAPVKRELSPNELRNLSWDEVGTMAQEDLEANSA